MKIDEKVEMIFHAVEAVERTIVVLDDAMHIGKKLATMGRNKSRPPIFGAKDDVIKALGVGGHDCLVVAPLRGAGSFLRIFRRLASLAYGYSRFGPSGAFEQNDLAAFLPSIHL
jgi:hypothetical protein